MPRYFFHIHDGVDKRDADGTALTGIYEARAEALSLAGRLICDAGLQRALKEEWQIEVTDEVGLVLFRMDVTIAESAAVGRVGDYQK